MLSADQLRPHQAVSVIKGRHAGAVGTVVKVSERAVQLDIAGVVDGQPVAAVVWLKLDQVEGAQHG